MCTRGARRVRDYATDVAPCESKVDEARIEVQAHQSQWQGKDFQQGRRRLYQCVQEANPS